MTLNTFKCNYLTPLHFKGLINIVVIIIIFSVVETKISVCNNLHI